MRAYKAKHTSDESSLELPDRARLRELERRNRELETENTFLKKGHSVLCAGAAVKYSFIAAQYAANLADPTADAPTITKMCTWLKVSKSGFYEWRGRPASSTAKRHASLKAKILALFDASDGTYRYRRLHAALLRSGEDVGPELVRRLVRELGLVACQPRSWRVTTVRDGVQAAAGDLVERDFTATAPGAKLVGDITYIRTWRGGCIWHGDRLLQS